MKTEFGFIGWCKDEKENHDKIWGYFLRPTDESKTWGWDTRKQKNMYGWNCVVFWGRRGKAMQFKGDVTCIELHKLVGSKERKGYVPINEAQLYAIWPTFDEEMKLKLSFEVLVGNVK